MLSGTDYKEITKESTDILERKLYNVIQELKIAAGINYMPRIFLIDADTWTLLQVVIAKDPPW